MKVYRRCRRDRYIGTCDGRQVHISEHALVFADDWSFYSGQIRHHYRTARRGGLNAETAREVIWYTAWTTMLRPPQFISATQEHDEEVVD